MKLSAVGTTYKFAHSITVIVFCLIFYFRLSAQDVTLKINLRGVHESKISLLPLAIGGTLKPIWEVPGVKSGEPATIYVPKDKLPGEFVLRFDYTEKETGTPYPSEKRIFINKQNLELWVNPVYCNNNDSIWFQKDEKENTLFAQFTKESDSLKSQISILQNLLMNYDDTQSKFYKYGIKEYDLKRNKYNQWITEQAKLHKSEFVSHSFQFQFVPKIEFNGSESDRINSVISQYFYWIDFKDSLILKTTALKDWMNNYVNLYGALSKTESQRDSLFPLAGKIAIEKARMGDPRVYGWMVDYFYYGYESFNLTEGIKMLQPYLSDTNCLTSKRQAITKRIKGMETLLIGATAPDFTFKDESGKDCLFSQYKSTGRFILLLFWSADCGHCRDLIIKLYPWYNQLEDKKSIEVFALSLDESATEIPIWQSAITQLQGWKHIRCEGGINSREANAYFILATPVMILVDSQTKKIRSIPRDVQELNNFVTSN